MIIDQNDVIHLIDQPDHTLFSITQAYTNVCGFLPQLSPPIGIPNSFLKLCPSSENLSTSTIEQKCVTLVVFKKPCY